MGFGKVCNVIDQRFRQGIRGGTILSQPTLTFLQGIQLCRPKTLSISIAPIIVGSFAAYPNISWQLLLLCVICALMLQITVNIANDYFDGLSGVDTHDRVGPKRLTMQKEVCNQRVKLLLVISLFISAASGIFILLNSHWLFTLFGALSLLAALAYSGGPFPLANYGLGELTVFLFFGLLAVLGSFYLQSQFIGFREWIFALMMGLPASAIMLVNNIRDIQTDRLAKKYTLAVRLGFVKSLKLLKFLVFTPLAGFVWLGLGDHVFWWLGLLLVPVYLQFSKHQNDQSLDYNLLLMLISQWLLLIAIVICWLIFWTQ